MLVEAETEWRSLGKYTNPREEERTTCYSCVKGCETGNFEPEFGSLLAVISKISQHEIRSSTTRDSEETKIS